jgi:hypothetical protein
VLSLLAGSGLTTSMTSLSKLLSCVRKENMWSTGGSGGSLQLPADPILEMTNAWTQLCHCFRDYNILWLYIPKLKRKRMKRYVSSFWSFFLSFLLSLSAFASVLTAASNPVLYVLYFKILPSGHGFSKCTMSEVWQSPSRTKGQHADIIRTTYTEEITFT